MFSSFIFIMHKRKKYIDAAAISYSSARNVKLRMPVLCEITFCVHEKDEN